MTYIHRLELDVAAQPHSLMRVVAICHRRGCRIVDLHFERGGVGRPSRIRLSVSGDAREAARLRIWLANLVDVVAVRRAATAPGPRATRRGVPRAGSP